MKEEKIKEKEKTKLTLRLFIVRLTGILFALYSAYSLFVFFRDIRREPLQTTIIYAVVTLAFASLAFFAWTSEVNNYKFIRARRILFIVTLSVVTFLKLRLAARVIAALDFSEPLTFLFVLYGAAFFMTLMALLILLVYYTFIRKAMPLYPKARVILPLAAMILFVLSLAAEVLLYVFFHFGLEGNLLRTVTSRPVFYLSFIGLSAYFLYPPRIEETDGYIPPDDSEFIKPDDDAEYVPPEGSENVIPDENAYIKPTEGEYVPPEGSERVMPDTGGFVSFDDSEHTPPKGSMHIMVDDSDFVAPNDGEYVPPAGSERAIPDDSEFINFDHSEHIPPKGTKHIMIDESDFVKPDDGEYVPPKGSGRKDTEGVDFVQFDDSKYIPPKGSGKNKPKGTDFIAPDDGSYV